MVNLLLCEFGSGAGNNQKSKRKQISKPFNRIFIHQNSPDRKSFQLQIVPDAAINEKYQFIGYSFFSFLRAGLPPISLPKAQFRSQEM
jgi:hypothetical protein